MSTAAELTAPPSLVIEVSLLRAIPVSDPVGTTGPRLFFELLPRKAGGFLSRIVPSFGQAILLAEVTRTLTTPETFAAGTLGSRLSIALPLSYAGFHQRPDSNRRPLDPM
jgi:hypothetical protein